MNELEKYVQRYFSLTEEEMSQITELFRPLTLKKGDYFLPPDRYARRLGFVQSGLLREFIRLDGKEVTKWIAQPGYFTVDLGSFLFDQPARWQIQALTDCHLFVIHQDDYRRIDQAVPRWAQLEKLFIARCFTVLEDRVFTFLAMSAQERYDHFFHLYPHLLNQVPLQYLASMLGMTPETLSRIRRKALA